MSVATSAALTPAMQQYHRMKAEHPDALLFFRMGDFYELFFEDAVVASRALEIALTSRAKDRDGAAIPMCGVPHHAVTGYVARLVKQGFRVALCEQMEDPRSAKGVVRREVVRVVTPGTQLEASALEAGETSYVLAISPGESALGAAWLDATTGDFFVSEWTGPSRWDRLRDEVGATHPREILVPRSAELPPWLADPVESEGAIPRTPVDEAAFDSRSGRRDLVAHFAVASLEPFGCEALSRVRGLPRRRSDTGHADGLQDRSGVAGNGRPRLGGADTAPCQADSGACASTWQRQRSQGDGSSMTGLRRCRVYDRKRPS